LFGSAKLLLEPAVTNKTVMQYTELNRLLRWNKNEDARTSPVVSTQSPALRNSLKI